MAEAERIAAGLVKSDGGGHWRVYGLTRVQLSHRVNGGGSRAPARSRAMTGVYPWVGYKSTTASRCGG